MTIQTPEGSIAKWVWEIEDGETHHVVASGKEEALEVLARAMDYPSVAHYLDNHGTPAVRCCGMSEDIDVRLVDESVPEGFPQGATLIVKATAFQWSQMPKGLICSTVY